MTAKSSFCGSSAHRVDRRLFLQGGVTTALGVSLAGMGMPVDALMAGAIGQKKKQVILIWLAGGASQFETFDPKPGRPTGGPFKAIQTTVPGIQVCELMPKMAMLMKKMAIVRSLDTKIGDHGGAADLMSYGRRPEAAVDYPDVGTVLSKELGQRDAQVPEFVSMYLATEGQPWGRPHAGYLGGRYAAMSLERTLKPDNLDLPAGLSAVDHADREHYRKYLSDRFNRERTAPQVVGYNSTFARVKGLMASDKLFDIEQESAANRAKYGNTEFGQHCLIARRLIEAGTPVVKVSRAWWDTHSDNFESHRELVTELDHVMSTLIRDLEERGLLESTLIVTLSEFGRTPAINKDLGRDHFASAWSFTMTGTGVKGGTVYGATDPDGKTVKDGKVGAAEVAATIFNAVGISHEKKYYVGARPVPIAPEHSQPIKAVLS